MSLNSFFYPKSVAIVGASNNPAKTGYQVSKHLIELGYEGGLYFINQKEEEVLGRKAYRSILEIQEEIECVVVAIPSRGVVDLFEQLEQRDDVKAAVVVASGFSETGIPENAAMEKAFLEIARNKNIRVMGPNCVGVMNTENHLDTTFAPNITQKSGGMSIITQSGSVGSAILMFTCNQPVPMGFNKWAHVGNMTDVTTEEILNYYLEDDGTRVVAMYMEGMQNARQFFATAKEFTAVKPLIILKVGRSEIGNMAASSHTGTLAGSDKIFDGAFRQTGVIRVETIEELVDTAKAFDFVQDLKGNRIAILTEAGGPGVISMDVIGANPVVQMAKFSAETERKLKEVLPPMALISHPDGYVDMTAQADGPQHSEALKIIIEDEGVDAVLLFSVPPTFLPPVAIADHIKAIGDDIKKSGKPVFACFLAGDWIVDAHRILEEEGIPTFEMPDRAAQAMVNVMKYYQRKRSHSDSKDEE